MKQTEGDNETFFTNVGLQEAYEMYEEMGSEEEDDPTDADDIMEEFKRDVLRQKNVFLKLFF